MKPSIKSLLSIALTVSIIIISCQKLDVQRIMVVKTKSVSNVLVNTANVNGELVDLGEGMTDFGVYYSTTPIAKNGTKFSMGRPISRKEYTAQLTELTMGTKYYTQAYGEYKGEYVYGSELLFTTIGKATITSTVASAITANSALLGGSVIGDGGSIVSDRGIYWRLASDTDTLGTKLQITATGLGVFSITLSNLNPNTAYTFRVYATNIAGTKFGEKIAFNTKIGIPILSTTAISNITNNSAVSGGNISIDGGDPVVARGVCWGLNLNPTKNDAFTIDGTGNGIFISNLSPLLPGKTYHVRAYASNSAETGYGQDVTFATPAVKPTITTSAISIVTTTTASSGGNVLADGGASVTARGICWSTTTNPTIDLPTKTSNGTGTGSFTSSMTNLNPGVTYHVRAYATNSLGTSYGEDVQFTAITTLPTISTVTVTGVGSTTAISGGNIITDGGAVVTDRGVCWDTNINPTSSLVTKTSDGTGTGTFSSSLAGLSLGTTYHIRAYAVNSVGTAYGSDLTFTTFNVPTLTTSSISSITANTASSGGNISSDGGSAVSERGICWSTVQNPTTADSKTSNGTGAGAFTSSLTNLQPGTKYYVRSFATNGAGTSYGGEVSFTTLTTIPTVTTADITDITSLAAISGGEVTSTGGVSVTSRGVCWNTATSPSIALTTKTTDGSGLGAFTSSLIGLTPGTTYYIRAYATNSFGTAYGTEKTFTTSAVLPTVTTTDITNILLPNATSGGNVTATGGSTVTARGVCWSTTSNPTTNDSKTTNGTGTGIFTSTLAGLQSATTYYVRAYATNSVGTAYGSEKSFLTGTAPTVTTLDITGITSTSSSSGGNVTASGGSPVTGRGVCWSTTSNPTIALTTKTVDGSGTGTFTSSLTGLSPNTTYYVRAYATNTSGTGYGSEKTFITLSIPMVSTEGITGITATTASGGGEVTFDGYTSVTARGICWSTNQDPTTANSKTVDGTGTGIYTSILTGLVPNTTYYVKAYATNIVGTNYGTQVTFKTGITLPTVTTVAISGITATAATTGGNITSDGGSSITARGVCWNTSHNPNLNDGQTYNGTGAGTFTSNISGLIPGTYYVRAYATNSVGTSYGNEVSFTTAGLPILSTSSIISITETSATGGGNITSNGGSSVTARGVCWSTSTNPTINLSTKTSDGIGSGIFSSNITGLTNGTTYYVRAYATNSAGTSYGNEVSFATPGLPVLTSSIITNILETSASSGGNISSDGGYPITARGVCWSTNSNPTITLTTKTTDGTGNGVFTSSLTGLVPSTIYYVRAYATNSVGTSYGSELNFKTLGPPILSTSNISYLSDNSAVSGGKVTSDEGAAVSQRGVCWNTSPSPTIDLTTKTINGSGTGTFSSTITGLIPGTSYYVRAYATNSIGTSYGNEIIYIAQSLNTGFVAFYPFNGNVNDESGNGNNGTNYGATLTTDRFGVANRAYSFNGTNNWISIPETNNFDFGSQDFTICYWEYRTSSTSGKGAIARDNSIYSPFLLGWYENTQMSLYMSSDNSNWNIASSVSMGTPKLNNWTFYLIQRNGNTFKLYQNGVLISTFTSSLALMNVTGALQIGKAQNQSYYGGILDDIRIYNRALSTIEINALYNN